MEFDALSLFLRFASLYASQGGKASRSERCFIDPSRPKPL